MKIRIARISEMIALLSILGFPFVAAISSVSGLQSTPLSISMRSIILVFSFVVLWRGSLPAKDKYFHIFFSFLLVFWLFYLSRILSFTELRPDSSNFELSYYVIWGVGTCFIPMMAILHSKNSISSHSLLKLFFFVCLASSLLALPQARSSFYVNDVLVNAGRLRLDSLNPISLGSLGAVLIYLSTWQIFNRKDLLLPSFFWLPQATGLAAGTYLLVFSGSRGPMVALLMTVMFMVFSVTAKNSVKIVISTIFIFAISTMVLPMFSADLLEATLNRIDSAISGSDLSTSLRMLSFSGAWGVFVDYPIAGGSMEEPNTNFYPHNILLEVLMSTGILGFVFFIPSIYLGVLFSYKLVRNNSSYAWIGPLFLMHLTQAQFSGALYQLQGLWVLLALVAKAHTLGPLSETTRR